MSYSRFHDSSEGSVYFPQILLLQSTSHVYQGLYSRIFYLSILVSPRLFVQWKLSGREKGVYNWSWPLTGILKIQSLYGTGGNGILSKWP